MSKSKRHNVVKTLSLYLVLIFVALFSLAPLLWMLSTSLKTDAEILSPSMSWIPNTLKWDNFAQVFERTNFNLNYWNSVFVAIVVTSGQVATSAMAGYAFSRLNWPGRDKVFIAYLATLMIPVTVTMLPNFIILRQLRWLDTYYALTIPAMFTAYGTFLCRQFMMGLPRDLEEAAMIDGCSHVQIFFNVIIPMSTPVLATLSILTFMGTWRNFAWPLVVTYSEDLRVLPIALYSFQGEYKIEYNLLMAASLMMILPSLVLFIFGQKFFVQGIRLGAVKG
ncbi:MAG: carbohydrate ABC transporter permease [Victivallales bacterium]|nr:carbohydrate ABC transporter permease [Victivallales bacterium]